jgi:hypothetical protein
MLTLQELLYNRGLSRLSNAKLVRHKEAAKDLFEMYTLNREEFLDYQQRQGKDIFKDIEFIVSFIGEAGNRARFIGVYKVKSVKYGYSKIEKKNLYQYEFQEVKGFEDMAERIIIDWGLGTRSWVQNITTEKEIIEITPGLHYKAFTDYFDLILPYSQLEEIVSAQYPDWKRMLEVTNGIYLIHDKSTGKQYIGSTYGAEGIWGRWKNYITTKGHGNNKILKDLTSQNPKACFQFEFSILALLPKTITPDEAIKKETHFKRKLGTRAFGLNGN